MKTMKLLFILLCSTLLVYGQNPDYFEFPDPNDPYMKVPPEAQSSQYNCNYFTDRYLRTLNGFLSTVNYGLDVCLNGSCVIPQFYELYHEKWCPDIPPEYSYACYFDALYNCLEKSENKTGCLVELDGDYSYVRNVLCGLCSQFCLEDSFRACEDLIDDPYEWFQCVERTNAECYLLEDCEDYDCGPSALDFLKNYIYPRYYEMFEYMCLSELCCSKANVPYENQVVPTQARYRCQVPLSLYEPTVRQRVGVAACTEAQPEYCVEPSWVKNSRGDQCIPKPICPSNIMCASVFDRAPQSDGCKWREARAYRLFDAENIPKRFVNEKNPEFTDLVPIAETCPGNHPDALLCREYNLDKSDDLTLSTINEYCNSYCRQIEPCVGNTKGPNVVYIPCEKGKQTGWSITNYYCR